MTATFLPASTYDVNESAGVVAPICGYWTGPVTVTYTAGEIDPDADVLEDTPDFLQETPEHDRLWFEQKPPKDFDF